MTQRIPQSGDVYRYRRPDRHLQSLPADHPWANAVRHLTIISVDATDSRYVYGYSWWSAMPDRRRRTRVRLDSAWEFVPPDETKAAAP